MQISKLTSKTWPTFSGFGERAGDNTPTHVKPATTRQHPIDVPTHDRAMNTTGKDINALSTRIDTEHTQKHLILRFTRKTKQFVAFGLLLLAGIFTTPLSAQTTTGTGGICDRTTGVQLGILAAITETDNCMAVTATQLSAITSLSLFNRMIADLSPGDFAGLSTLDTLNLDNNNLTTIEANTFSVLTSLNQLFLRNNDSLTTIEADAFSGLTNLTTLNLGGNALTALPAGVFDNLTSLGTLNLRDNDLSELPDGLFSGLTRLTFLRLQENTFTTPLPANIFDPVSGTIQIDLSPIGDLTGVALTVGGSTTINVANAFISRDSAGDDRTPITYTLTPANTAIATVSLTGGVGTITGVAMGTTTVSVLANDGESGAVGMLTRDIAVTVVATGILAFDAATGNTIATPIVAEASGTDTFYVQLASAPASDVTLTLTSSDTSEGTVMPGTLTFTAAGGATPWDTRQAVTVTAVDDNVDRDDTFTVGFAIATAGDGDGGDYTNLLTIPSVAVTVTDDDVAASICSRTMQVQTAILARIPGSPACADVIESQLAAITGILFVNNMMGLTTLLPGDFADLSGITALFLDGNGLTTLPSGIFSDLGRVTILDLNGNALATLPAGAFAGLTSLSTFDLSGNALTALPAGLFTGLTSLTSLDLSRNALTTLPANAFSGLTTSFITLFLNSNALTTLPANAFSGLTGVTTLDLSNNMLSALPAGLFTGLGTLTSLRLAGGNTFTTPLPANLSLPPNLFDPTSVSSAEIRIDLSPIGDLADIPSLTLGGVATINVANAFISRDSVGDDRALSFTITPTGTSVASATESGGVLTITASDTITGVTTIDIVADDSVSSTVTRDIAVTVVEVGLAFFEEVDSATGSTEVTSITTGEPDVAATFYVELISAPTADVTVTVMSDDTTEGMITTGASLTFTTGNWNIRQPVTVTGQDDNLIDVDTSYNIALASTSSDANYNALTETLSATNTDDDVAVDICSRTTEVQTAILNAISPSPICSTVTESQLAAITSLDLSSDGITSLQTNDFTGLNGLATLNLASNFLATLPANIFDALTSLTTLNLSDNGLSALPAGVFNGLTSLNTLQLNGNMLTTLPANLFSDLTSLTSLRLQGNPITTPLPANLFDPLPDAAVIEIDLSPIGDLADIPSLTLGGVATINVANAFISRNSAGTDRALSFTITPTGTSVVSATEDAGVLTITASDTITGVTTIDIVADDTESSTVTRNIAVTVADVVNICSRTMAVQTAILAAIPTTMPATTCSTVTGSQLATITGSLNLSSMSISALLPGDFADLSGITELRLDGNDLSTLPAGIFNPLTALTSLDLSFNSLTMLPSGIFSTLTNLTALVLWDNSSLGTLESDVFSALTNLTRLDLQNTGLSALPAGLFTGLTNLTELRLHDNAFTTPLPANLFDPVPSAVITIDLSPIGDLADIVLTFGTTTMINVADAFISRDLLGNDRNLSFTITPTGTSVTSATESSGVLTITASGTIAGVTTIDIVADDDSGGANADLTRTIAVTVDTVVDICSRTAAVQTAILETISLTSPPACDAVTEGQLAAVAFLNLGDMSITALQSGDFADLSGLTLLVLSNNSLGTLPSGIFSGLTNLGSLFLSDSDLSALESDVFSALTSLTGLALSGNSLTSLPDGLFDNLTNLTSLELADNDLTALEVGIFDPLTSLTNLDLFDNDLTALPANLFDRLTSLTALSLEDNTFTTPLPADIFDPLPSDAVISIDLSPIGDLADVALTLGDTTTINVANAFISRNVGGDDRPLSFTTALTGTSVTSATESSGVLTITASDTMTGMTSVEITASDSTGGTTGMSARTISVTVTEPAVNICDRTTMVETAILAAIPANPACDAVTATQLAAITGVFDLSGVRIQTLQVGDFAGLSGVTSLNLRSNFIFTANALPAGVFTGLTSLTELNLGNHPFVPALQAGLFDDLTSLEILHLDELTRLTALPAGVFDNLTNLTQLNLRNAALTALPAGVFDNLMSLTRLQLEFNALSALPAGVFDNLMSLTRLDLNNNGLTALPAGVFDGLTSLGILHLFNNNLTALPAGLFDNLASLTELNLDNNTFTTPLPADIFDSISSADISLGLFPIGELPGVALTASGTTTINVTNAFIDRDGTSNAVITNFSAMSNDTTVATAMESGGVVTITGAGMGTTTVSVTASSFGDTSTRDIAVTVVATGILAFDGTTGDTLATPIVAEASGTDTFYVQLASAPASDVTLTLTSSDTNEGTVMPGTLTFTAAAGTTSWDTRQLVTVTAVDDNSDRDGDSFTVNFAVTAGDGGDYPIALAIPNVTVTITDDDTAGIDAYDMLTGGSEISTITTSETGAGNVATFYVALTSQPTGTVTVTISGLVATEHTLTAPVSDTLTFTPTGATAWNTRQVITLNSVDDNVVDGDQMYDLTLTPTGGDYTGVAAQTVSVTNSDTDTAVLTIADMSVNEDAGTATLTVMLTPAVTVGDVTVNAMTMDGTATAGEDYTAITSQTLTFTAGSTSETLDIPISDDNIGEGNETFTVMLDTLVQPTGVTTVSITDATAEVTITDDETAPTTIDLGVSPSTIAETADATEIIVTATLGDGSASLPTDTEVTLTISGTATGGGTDYTLTMPISTITIAALATSATKTFMIDPTDDSTTEGEETVIISGTATINGMTATGMDTLTILEAGILVFESSTGDTAPDVVATEDGGMDTFYVRLASQPANDVTLSLTSSDVNEGTVSPLTLTFTAAAGATSWDTRQLVTVTAVPDGIDRDDTFTVNFGITDGDGANYETATLTLPMVTVTVTDDDTVGFTVDIGDGVTTSEGSTTPDTFSVVLDSEPTDTVTVTIDGLVTTEHSLTPSTTLTFTTTNWSTAQTITLNSVDDNVVDGDQMYDLTLTPAGGDYTGVAAQTVSVTNSDTDTAELSIADATVNEGDGMATLTVTLSAMVTVGTVEVNANTIASGTATEGADYTNTNQALTFLAGSTSETLDIPINDDGIVEGDETFAVRLSTLVTPPGVTTVRLASDRTAEVTIIDNDMPGLAVDIGDGVTTSEGSTASDTFSVVLNTQPTADVTVTISGLVTTEHSLTPSTTLTFTTTNWSTAQTITLNSVDDNVVDGDQMYDLTLTPAGGDYTGVAAQTVSVTNSDTDTAVLTIADMSVDEDAGTATVTVTLTPAVTAGNVLVDATTMDGTATTAGTDYTAITSQTLTFTAGSTSETLDITISDDSIAEGNEAFTVMLGGLSVPSAVSGDVTIATDDTAEVTITDDETVPTTIDLGISPSTIAETAGATDITVTATLGDGSVSLSTDTVVTLTISGTATITTDYTLTMPISTITIAALATSGTKTFMIDPIDDTKTEGEETVIIGGTAGSFTVNSDTLTIVEAGILVFDATTGDTAPDVVAAENNGTDTFYVRLASAPARDVTLTLTSSDTNEGAVSPLTLTFTAAAGTTSWDTRQLVTVTAVPDDIDRDDSFTVDFEIATAGDGDGANYLTTLTLPSVTVMVTDDDTVGFTVDIGDGVTTSEGSATPDTFSVVLNSEPTDTVTITITGLVATEHSLTPSTTLMFTTGNWDTAQTVMLTGENDDDVDGDQTYSLTLTPTGGGYTGVAVQMVSVTNTDTDTAELTIADMSVNEDAGTATVTVTLTPAVTAGTVTVNAMTVDGTATGADYTAITSQTLTFTAGSTTQTLDITINDDSIAEGNEAFTVMLDTLVQPTGVTTVSITDATAIVTIIDDDVPGLAVDIGDGVTTSEGSTTSDTFSVVLNTQPTADVTVTISGLDATEHSLTPSTTLMFTTTNWSTAQTVTLNSVDDNVVDGDQMYDLTLTASGGDYTGVAAQTVSVTNSDDDTAMVTIADTSVGEGAGTATVTVTLSAMVTTGDVMVQVTTADGTATAGEDYTAITSQTLTITAGTISQTLDITINDDLVDEGDSETFTVMLGGLSAPTGVTIATDDTATVTITDDDTASDTIDLSVNPSTVAETASATTVTVTATLDGTAVLPTPTVVTVSVGESGDSAVEGIDYVTVADFTLTIQALSSSGMATFMIDPDTSSTNGDTVTIDGTSGSFTFTSTTLTIVEAGILVYDAMSAGNQISTTTIAEASGSDILYVQLASQPAGNVTLSVESSDTNEGTVSTPTLTFTTANWNARQPITITAIDDNVDRDGDSFMVDFMITSGDSANYTSSLMLPSVAVTVTDDDMPSTTINLSISPDRIQETAGETTITVTATLNGAASITDTAVEVIISGGTASPNTDYMLAIISGSITLPTSALTTITIPAEMTSSSGTFAITPVAGDVSDNGETITISGTSGSLTVNAATLTIDEAGILVYDEMTAGTEISTTTIAEASGTDMLYVQLASAPASDVTLSVMSSDTNEGTVMPAALTFTAANWNTRQAVTVTAVPDQIDRDDTFTVAFAVTTGDSGNYTTSLMLPSVTVTITDDDTVSDTINLSISPDRIQETAGETTITVTATLDGAASATDTVVEVIISDGGEGTATPNTDYTLAIISSGDITIPTGTITLPTSALTTIRIPAEMISGSGTFAITPVADDESETPDETVIISGTAPGFTTITPATLTIDEFSERDQQAIEQTVAAQASGITQVVTEQIGIRLVSRASTSSGGGGSTQDRQSLSSIDWQDDLAKFTYEGLKRLDSGADIMSLDWLLRAAGGNGQVVMPLGAESLTLWATGGRISTKGDGVADYDGDVNSFILGIDTALANDWLAGIAISYNDSEIDYTMDGTPEAETEQTLYAIHPYLSRTLSQGLTLWGTAGYGFGDIDFSHTRDGQATSDVTQWMAAGGLEQQIITNTPWQGALRIKGLWGNAEVDATTYDRTNRPINKVDTDFWRARMESEMGYNFQLPGGNVRPYAIIGARWDHSDATIVSGDEWHVDVGGGVELSDNAFALNISLHTQVTEGDTEEHAVIATGSVTYDLEQDGRGLQIALSRPLDNTSPAWDSHSFSPLTDTASGLSGAPLTSELAYGWTVHPFGLEGALQTYVQNSFESSERHYAVGLELAVNALTLSFETGYHDHTSLNSGETDNTGLESLFKTKIRW